MPYLIITKNKLFGHYHGFSLFVFVWMYQHAPDKKRLFHHENIHFRQQIEMLFIPHWILYVFYYFLNRLKGLAHNEAYRQNPFEKEAYANDHDFNYLVKRKFWAWTKYV